MGGIVENPDHTVVLLEPDCTVGELLRGQIQCATLYDIVLQHPHLIVRPIFLSSDHDNEGVPLKVLLDQKTELNRWTHRQRGAKILGGDERPLPRGVATG